MSHQVTTFKQNLLIKANGKKLDFRTPKIMGVINLTPDSFYSSSRIKNHAHFLLQAEKMLDAGVHIIDIGAVSTRPGANDISESEELSRLIPALRLLRSTFPEVIISVDTYRSYVALAAAECGADMINDVYANNFDGSMFRIVAQLKLPYILMHMKGTPATMQQKPNYNNAVREVMSFFRKKIKEAQTAGIRQIIIDPGFGFGKTLEHNYQLLKCFSRFNRFSFPVLAGLSRKSMVTRLLDIGADEALTGTVVLNTIALLNGASLLRVHDVLEASHAIRLVEFYKSA